MAMKDRVPQGCRHSNRVFHEVNTNSGNHSVMSKTRLASAVILTRGTDKEPEVFLVKRAPQLRFMGGYWAFPGGTLSEYDYLPGDESEDRTFIRCAMRELFEETGILPGDAGLEADIEIRNRARQELLQKDSSFDAWLRLVNGKAVPEGEFSYICSITTPPISPVRYQTRFLHVMSNCDTEPSIISGELIDGRFFRPADAVAAWERGEMEIAPPNLFLLRLMSSYNFPEFKKQAAIKTKEFSDGALHPVYFSPGIFMAPLKTPTLPPATTTNVYMAGTNILYLIDPATPYAEEQERLFAKMDELIDEGKQFASILLTHHHIDHVGAVTAASRRYQLPVRAHESTYKRIPEGFLPGEPLKEGDRIELGFAPDGTADWHLQVLYTPGHASDHLCFFESRYHALIAGDMLSTLSTIVIDPPDGHMRTYLESLHRLLELPIKKLYPAHGPIHDHGEKLIGKYIEHRREREQAIIRALGDKPRSLEQLLPKVYDDVDEGLLPVASRSLLAGLIKLEEDKACRKIGEKWQAVSGTGTIQQHE